jgi:hypothetical protein
MRTLTTAVLLLILICAAQATPAQPDPQSPPSVPNNITQSTLVVPAGTAVELALISPILARTAKPGESVYAETAFPVAVNNQIAIPPGTYIEGQIDSMARPAWRSPHAQFQIHFTKIIFANGYTVVFPGPQTVTTAQQHSSQTTPAPEASVVPVTDDVLAAVASPYVDVSSSNDVLLDNGSQVEMVLQVPLPLLADRVAVAARMARTEQLPQFKSATLCRPTYGSPGSPDTVIPGTAGTPPTVIPGGPGMPDTVIPGTPGMSPTTIGGSPSTPGTVCPGPPVVTSNPKVPDNKQTFQIGAPVRVSAMQLAAGVYQVTWSGAGPSVQVEILQNGNLVVSARARVVILDRESPSDLSGTGTNSDSSVFLQSLRFAGQSIALYFNQGGS